jgi:hypothetical protein
MRLNLQTRIQWCHAVSFGCIRPRTRRADIWLTLSIVTDGQVKYFERSGGRKGEVVVGEFC